MLAGLVNVANRACAIKYQGNNIQYNTGKSVCVLHEFLEPSVVSYGNRGVCPCSEASVKLAILNKRGGVNGRVHYANNHQDEKTAQSRHSRGLN